MNNGETLSIRQLTPCVGMIKKPVYRWLVLGRTDRGGEKAEERRAARRNAGCLSEASSCVSAGNRFGAVPKRKPAFFLFVTFFFWTPKRKSKSTLKK